MKVSVSDFELKLLPFMQKIATSMPTKLHQFIGGAMIASGAAKFENLIKGMADAEGMVELDDIKKLIKAGFNASGGEVVIPFGSEGLAAFGIRPVNIKIRQSDADEFFAGF